MVSSSPLVPGARPSYSSEESTLVCTRIASMSTCGSCPIAACCDVEGAIRGGAAVFGSDEQPAASPASRKMQKESLSGTLVITFSVYPRTTTFGHDRRETFFFFVCFVSFVRFVVAFPSNRFLRAHQVERGERDDLGRV